MTPGEKLAHSRLAIIEYLTRKERRNEKHDEETESADAQDEREQAQAGEDSTGGNARRQRSSRSWWSSGIGAAARGWWRHHPAQVGLEMVTPMVQSYMRRRPFQILGISVAVGALLVITRPWRLISLTTVVVALVKSSQLSGVVMSAISHAQGWRSQHRGHEPEL